MSPHAYTEDQLVERPAIDELARARSAMSLEAANREAHRLPSGQIDVEALDHA